MSKTTHEMPKYRKNKRSNFLGICNCIQCRHGRMGKKDSQITRIKRKLRLWKSNKTFKRGAYTD